MKILHISDLHFGQPYHPEVGAALLRLAPSLEPDLVVASGDFTQRAKVEEYKQARALLDELPDAPQIVVPGNHDVPLYRIWERLTRPHANYREYISEDLETSHALDGVFVVALDTTSPRRTISRGRITSRQVKNALERFSHADPDDWKVLVVHHHFVDAPDALRDRGMLGGEKAMKQFIDAGVDLVLGGHLHRAYIGNTLDFFFEGRRDRGTILVQSGTTTSRRGRGREKEKNSFNLLDIHDEWLEVTHFLFFEDEATFGPMSRHVFPRPDHRLVFEAHEDSAVSVEEVAE